MNGRRGPTSGFTLVELLSVIAIIAILAIVVVLTLNPAQLLAQARDSRRISDMASLASTLNMFETDQVGGYGTSAPSIGSASTTYVSVYDPAATSTAGTLCGTVGLPTQPTGYAYHCAASSTYTSTAASGWVPVNFAAMSSGNPFSSLPVDPTNSTSSRLYYTYSTDGTKYEFTAAMESTKYQPGGASDVISGDGGPLATVYEKGTKLGLEPLDYGDTALAGWWPMQEGSGTTVGDRSGHNDTMTLANTTWTAGYSGNAVNFGTSASLGTLASSISTNPAPYTIMAWALFPLPTTAGGWRTLTRGTDHQWLVDVNGNLGDFDNVGATGFHSSGFNINSLAGWHLVAVTGQGSTALFYVDGGLVGTASFKSNDYVNVIGNCPCLNQNFGTMQDLRIYTRALNGATINALYKGGK